MVMEKGVEQPYFTVFSKTVEINGQMVMVTYSKTIDGLIRISNSWVITK